MTAEGSGRLGEKLGTRRVHTGTVISLDVDTVRFPDGSTGDLEMVRHPGASAVIPFLTDPGAPDPQILLLRQYRWAANEYLYEIPAGRLEAGEEPLSCAKRELREETGCTATKFEPLLTMFTTPGFTDERIHLFMATGLTRGKAETDSDEFIEVVPMSLEASLEMIRRGEIKDGKSALAILFAAGYKLGL
jgi:ADP-ribose pyrophosphatase